MKEINLKDATMHYCTDKEYGNSLDALKAVLKDVQNHCSARTVEAETIVRVLHGIYSKLAISQKAMNGLTVDVDINAQKFPHSYKWTPESTQFSAVFKSGSWRITDVRRYTTKSPSKAITVHHTEASLKAITEKYTDIAIISVI